MNRAHTSTNYLARAAQMLVLLLGFSVLQMWSNSLQAQELTRAGTVINNTATASYVVSGVTVSQSASVTFTVQEVIDVAVSWTDGSNIIISSADTGAVTSFDIANTGNGSETFSLSVANAVGDEFDFLPISSQVEIFIESGATPGFQEFEDILYTGGPGDNPTIAAESTQTVYLRAEVPAAAFVGLIDGNKGWLELTVASTTVGAVTSGVGAPAGTTLLGVGDGSVDAIIGTSQALSTDTAIYQLSSVSLTIAKAITLVADPYGGATYVPGTEVTYRITVNVGAGTAAALAIVDPIPANTTYQSGSLFLGGAPLTDLGGDDVGDFNISQAGAITVTLGDTAAPALINIDLTVVID
jgi:uncharacterized repeat protein (TIGR01451 family)